ncbi:hypothetical protein [Pimelobacter simplex]|uniref:hypothetical protein n=1 Tax=Nocardioides simplex TaxID=2045 RepID=UPI00214FC243|nr:hypothetical protein [Pimelobacter simplex]UUW90972.1 hypothetical protein M0M43_05675 [Pimelobacter simplex]UUW94801.1 hypothetical protein M0M48_24180 [Pimelobacter simplex]
MRPNTPGPGGYVAAWAVSVLIVDLAMVLGASLFGTSPGPLELVLMVWGLVPWVALFSLPIAVPGVLIVHLVCRCVGAQWVHVAAAGLAGLAPMGVWVLLTGEAEPVLGLLAVATALGRLAVVPMVRRRRDGAQQLLAGPWRAAG